MSRIRMPSALAAILPLLLMACSPEDALRSTGADVSRIRVYREVHFAQPPTPEEFAAKMQRLPHCPEFPQSVQVSTRTLALELTERHQTIPDGIRTVRVAVDLPTNMRPFLPLTHSNASWWQDSSNGTIAFIGGSGEGSWTISDVTAPNFGGVEPCWEYLMGHVAYRKVYSVPHREPGQPPIWIASGAVVFRRNAEVSWHVSAPTRDAMERLSAIAYTLRERS